MSGTVGKRAKGDVRIGPDIRKYKAPLIAFAAAGALAFDSVHLHLLRHLLGPGSGLVVWIVIILGAAWGARRLWKGRGA